MKILIASGAGGGTAKKSIGKFFHLKEFGEALKKNGVDYKLVREIDYISGFPSKDLKSWFSKKKFYKLIEEYEPDLVFVDRQSHFGLEAIKAGIPLFVYLRGHFWMEQEWAKKTIYKDPVMKTVVNLRAKIAEDVFKGCQGIFMTADYLDNVIKEHIPNAKSGNKSGNKMGTNRETFWYAFGDWREGGHTQGQGEGERIFDNLFS